MQFGTVAGIITAVATMITAVGGIYLGRRVQEVHKLVNQRFTDMENWNIALQKKIVSMGGTVPDDQSKGGISAVQGSEG